MGEYAIRKSDGARIKIGTCEDMYYIRFDQRHLVKHEEGNVNLADDHEVGQLRFRLPFPDEHDMEPGEYDEHNRAVPLVKHSPTGSSWWSDESTKSDVGIVQLHHKEMGLLINVPCWHGLELPDVGDKCQAFWNGKGYSFVLSSLRAVYDAETEELQVFPIVRCRHCNQAWRYEWADVWEYIPTEMRIMLSEYRPKETRIMQ